MDDGLGDGTLMLAATHCVAIVEHGDLDRPVGAAHHVIRPLRTAVGEQGKCGGAQLLRFDTNRP